MNNDNIPEELTELETNISSDSSQEEEEVNQNETLWTDATVTTDSHRVYRSYSNAPIVHDELFDVKITIMSNIFEKSGSGYFIQTLICD
ncbi:2293_t:CDS:2 [Diversispora eburnea]|uniref:2293_t:CDS:1 n=1 Tax=Diversispora eburnea TaxID=1213867 RepID=A0A9N8ZML5_9GLOM|nr:2293_t:CDS:2 [Diversispora eburnea]